MRLPVLVLISTIFPTFLLASENISDYFMFNGFELEKTKLEEVSKSLGETLIYKEGDGSSSYTAICYHYPDDNITLYFESGEMGGGEVLLSYKVMKDHENKFPCRSISKTGTMKFDIAALKLGNSVDSTIKLLPKNINAKIGLTFMYSNKIPFTKEEISEAVANMGEGAATATIDSEWAYWNEHVDIEIFEKNGLVNGYSVSKVTSN